MSVVYARYLLLVAPVFLSLCANASAQTVCQYDANDEWPAVPDRVCQADDLPFAGLLADDASQHPYCQSAGSDPDGDGWGWENGLSCRVSGAGTRQCESASSDPDGDGWGWENGQSCRVDLITVVPQPVCESRLSDPDQDGWGWENGQSCQVTADTRHPECSEGAEDPDGDGWGYENNRSCLIVSTKDPIGTVFAQNFDDSTAGTYTAQQLNADWDDPLWHLGFVQGRVAIVPESQRGNVMTVTYPADRFGAAGAAAFLSDLELGVDLPASYEELYLSYDVRFGENFQFVKGGKLPGLCGFANSSLPVTGCNTGGGFPSGFDGWSARGMWREDGVLENYVYHSEQVNFYGDDLYWEASAEPGKWHRVQHRVLLNTPDFANGILEAWLDGEKVLSLNNLRYRKTADIGINLFYFSSFFGGNDASWAPTEDQTISFDNFKISTTPEDYSTTGTVALNDAVEPKIAAASGGGVFSMGWLVWWLIAGGLFRRQTMP